MIRAVDLFSFSLPLLRWLDPEDAHRLAVQGLKLLHRKAMGVLRIEPAQQRQRE